MWGDRPPIPADEVVLLLSDADDSAPDEFLELLTELEEAVQANLQRNQQALRRIEYLRDRREHGEDMAEIVRSEDKPLVLDLLRENLEVIFDVGARLRQTQVFELAECGLTHAQIAELLGVTRQRVGAILTRRRQGRPSTGR